MRLDAYETFEADRSRYYKYTTTTNPEGGNLPSMRRVIEGLQATGILVLTGARQVYGWYIANLASSVRYVKLYNKATAPTVGTDTPIYTIAIPANSAANVSFEKGIPFSLGLGIGGVTGVADSSTGAPTANDIIVNVHYY